jgi:hypothetical protein
MTFSTGSTRSSGYKILATDWNERVNNENFLGGTDRVVIASSTITTTLSDGVWSSAITFASDVEDAAGFHSTVSNTSRLTVPTGYDGVYAITANVYLVNSAAGQFHLMLRKNAAGSSSGGTFLAQASGSVSTNGAILTGGLITATVRLAATDYVEVFACQVGGGVALAGTTQAHRFGMTWISL